MNENLLTTLNLIADHLASMDLRLAAIEEDQGLTWAMVRQIWLNPAPGFVRRGPASTPVRQERVPALLPAPPKATGVSIPSPE